MRHKVGLKMIMIFEPHSIYSCTIQRFAWTPTPLVAAPSSSLSGAFHEKQQLLADLGRVTVRNPMDLKSLCKRLYNISTCRCRINIIFARAPSSSGRSPSRLLKNSLLLLTMLYVFAKDQNRHHHIDCLCRLKWLVLSCKPRDQLLKLSCRGSDSRVAARDARCALSKSVVIEETAAKLWI